MKLIKSTYLVCKWPIHVFRLLLHTSMKSDSAIKSLNTPALILWTAFFSPFLLLFYYDRFLNYNVLNKWLILGKWEIETQNDRMNGRKMGISRPQPINIGTVKSVTGIELRAGK